MCPGFVYRRVPDGRGAYFMNPPAVDPSTGDAAPVIIIGGDRYVYCNNDSSMARGVKGEAPVQDIYAPGWAPSQWEEEQE
jgi:hypothetical protein